MPRKYRLRTKKEQLAAKLIKKARMEEQATKKIQAIEAIGDVCQRLQNEIEREDRKIKEATQGGEHGQSAG